MSRRRAADKRKISPDAKFGDVIIAKFINNLMGKGKKSVAERIVYSSFEKVQSKKRGNTLELFHEAINSVKPLLEVRSRRVGGATYQVPTDVRPNRAEALAIRWIIRAAKKRSEKTMTDKLSAEFLDVLSTRGAAIKKREDTHKMAEANRAFAHYRW
ncbi:MAG: 30S ribosomal protein S7 [Alphaproteobacteria bacterium]